MLSYHSANTAILGLNLRKVKDCYDIGNMEIFVASNKWLKNCCRVRKDLSF